MTRETAKHEAARFEPDMLELFLQPGQYSVLGTKFRIRTLLGSCVSIVLWHPRARIGAMSHFLLPTRGGVAGVETPNARYADEAVALMLRGLSRTHVAPRECQAKLFGGGSMFVRSSAESVPGIGRRNGEAAQRLMRSCGIPIVAESLFGFGHREIVFEIRNGDVWSRQVTLRDVAEPWLLELE